MLVLHVSQGKMVVIETPLGRIIIKPNLHGEHRKVAVSAPPELRVYVEKDNRPVQRKEPRTE